MLPNRLFFTGAPGSRWSGIAQVIESLPGFNTSDRTSEREYSHSAYSGHVGAYFGPGMEFEPTLDADYIDQAWTQSGGCRIVKSHEWSEMLEDVHATFPEDWITCIYRKDAPSLEWWLEAGGYAITYPKYDAYEDMKSTIKAQNKGILAFVMKHHLKLERFTPFWIKREFGATINFDYSKYEDVFVTIWKP